MTLNKLLIFSNSKVNPRLMLNSIFLLLKLIFFQDDHFWNALASAKLA